MRCLSLLVVLTLAACHTPPPVSRLRYELDGPTEWGKLGDGTFGGELFGASVRVKLHDPDTLVKVVIENPTDKPVTFRLGPDAGSPKSAIGEVLQRALAGPAVGGPPMQSYAARQNLQVGGGWRATFYIDAPLGRKIVLGQYLVFSLVAEDGSGARERRLLPLVGKVVSPSQQRPR